MSLSTAVTLSVPGRQPWPPPRSSALWTYDGTTDSWVTTSSSFQTCRMTSTLERDIMVRLNAHIDTVNNIIWAPLSHQLTTQSISRTSNPVKTMPDACAMITEQGATIPAYSKSVSVRLNMRPGQTLNSKLSFFQPSRTCLKLGLTLEATPLIEVSSRAIYVGMGIVKVLTVLLLLSILLIGPVL